MGGSAEYRNGKRIQMAARNTIDEFLAEHSFQGRGGLYEGTAYEFIAGIAAATRAHDHDMVVTINRTAKNEYEGIDRQNNSNIKNRYDDMRKAVSRLYENPKMLRQLMSDYGITIQNATINNGAMDLTFSFPDRNGNTQTQTVRFDSEMNRFPGLDVRW